MRCCAEAGRSRGGAYQMALTFLRNKNEINDCISWPRIVEEFSESLHTMKNM
jgi:hypothetical protein